MTSAPCLNEHTHSESEADSYTKNELTYPCGREHEPDDESTLEGVVEWEPAAHE
jgi:hypothetical protein